jgi:hypothetical protein
MQLHVLSRQQKSGAWMPRKNVQNTIAIYAIQHNFAKSVLMWIMFIWARSHHIPDLFYYLIFCWWVEKEGVYSMVEYCSS